MIVANDDLAATPAATPVTVNILANDTKDGVPPVTLPDIQGLPTITLPPSNGTATVNPNGTVTYTPNPGFVGTDFFDYTILGQPGAPGSNDVDLYMGPGQITIHNLPIGVVVNWGDGSPIHTVQASDPTTVSHTYAAGGNYVCRISGTGDIGNGNQLLLFTGAALLRIPDWGVIASWGPAVATRRFSFRESPNLVQVPPTLPWQDSVVLDNVFRQCHAFNGDLSGWDTSNIVHFNHCFRDATSFNQPLPWDVGNAVSMQGMFNGATSFNQDISGWNTSNATDMTEMFNGATSFNQDLSAWCVENIATEPTNFAVYTPAWTLPKPNWGAPC